ncbi:hypothetical protein HanRHA438_Chr17g0795911 [Helianthus annuus]|nr:hypothetical protein HanIR_Chr17g0852651 [Helianthus annuus]KAJ0824762.1 hypothetical protein HanRHA438_Chr17g0795911 [Helianthus annuus]
MQTPFEIPLEKKLVLTIVNIISEQKCANFKSIERMVLNLCYATLSSRKSVRLTAYHHIQLLY